jgi:nucleoid DNA-binding protein
MIVEIIAKYLESNKRLVVPNLGTFIVKVPAQTILFSNLIKNDDGCLRGLLKSEGMSELDAAALIDRFVFEVNYRLEHSGVCALAAFGVLRAAQNGTVAFTYDTSAKGDVLDGDADDKMAKHIAEITSVIEPVIDHEPELATEPEEEETEDDEVTIDLVPRMEAEPATEEPKEEVKEEVKEEPQRQEPAKVVYAQEREDKRRDEKRHRREQNDYVKGLRYGKGRKVVTGREGATSRKSSKGSVIIVIAILAALIAMGALAYGLYNDWQNQQYLYEGLYDEPTTDMVEEPATKAEQGVRNPDLDYITPNE